MSDKEIIQGLINKDPFVTKEFFFERCKPLFIKIIKEVFDNKAEYDELVNNLYVYLMADDASILKSFQFRCSVYQWLKILAIRFFIRLRDNGGVIDDESGEPLYGDHSTDAMKTDAYDSAKDDLERLLLAMPNQRYALVIRRLVIEDMEPERLAQEMEINTSNLYNIKKRAIRQLTEVARKDINEYGKH